MNKDFMSPEYIEQNSKDSIVTADSVYDMEHISDVERGVVLQVLNNAKRKYPRKYRAIGIYNEGCPIIYKPRYLVFQVLIMKYENSHKPIDQFAVALAYSTKGAAGRKEAIKHLEQSLIKLTEKDLKNISKYMLLWAAFNEFSNIYEKEGYYDLALTYAKIALRLKGFVSPYDVTHPGEILKKVDINRCIEYYEGLLNTASYVEYYPLINEQLKQSYVMRDKGYVFKSRPRKQSQHSIDFDNAVREAAKQFL